MAVTMGFIVLLCLSACAGLNARNENYRRPDPPLLEIWLEETLVPYLVRQFSQHPRFKGQPVLLVRMQGENISDDIDDLTQQIREKITDALLQENGLNLVWRPTIKPWRHQRSLVDLSCGDGGRVRYYIGIDTGLSQVNRELYVKVKALNLGEKKWVSGFGKSWAGVPTPGQLKALQRERPDEHLLGMRPRPFSDRQPDLLAAYLAGKLSCKLKKGESDDLIVHLSPPAPGSPPVVKTALKLVGRYLARFKEVEVTDNPEHANVTLVSAVHSIDKDLHQVWISARRREGGIYVPEAETEAYLTLTAAPDTAVASIAHVKPQNPPPVQYLRQPPGPEIILSFNLLTPLDQTRCTAGKPWRSAARRVRPRASLAAGSCLAVEMRTTVPAYVFLLSQDALGELSNIFPSQCAALADKNPLVRAGELFQLPSMTDPRAGVLEIGGPPGTERIYAIAIRTPALAAEFVDRIDDIQGLCRSGKVFPNTHLTASRQLPRERILWWQNYLSRLSYDHPGQMDWRELKFDHRQL
jgi:hypothetical protein